MSEEKSYKQKFTEKFKDEWNKNHLIQSADEDELGTPYYSIYYNSECKVIVVVEGLFEGYYHEDMVNILEDMYPSENGSFEDLLSHIDDFQWYFDLED